MSDSASDALVFFGATGDLAYKKICGVFPVVRREARNLDWLFSGAESFRKSFGMMAGATGIPTHLLSRNRCAPWCAAVSELSK
jgi:hypothetical protein